MTQDDGTVEIGDFDVVPRLQHSDRHLTDVIKGARGLIALAPVTIGILGYRTDIAYKTKKSWIWISRN